MQKSFMPGFNNREDLLSHQLKGLQWTVKHAYNGSPFYRKKLTDAGVQPDSIATLDDIRRLPFTAADDFREGYPLPLLSVPEADILRVHASSGTTGKKKVLAYTRKDLDDWVHFVGYGIWTAGAGFQLGCEEFGALAIPAGPGNVDMQCQFLVDLQSTVMCCTASMGLLMAEEILRRGLKDKIALRKMIFGSERSSDAMRARIKEWRKKFYGGA